MKTAAQMQAEWLAKNKVTKCEEVKQYTDANNYRSKSYDEDRCTVVHYIFNGDQFTEVATGAIITLGKPKTHSHNAHTVKYSVTKTIGKSTNLLQRTVLDNINNKLWIPITKEVK